MKITGLPGDEDSEETCRTFVIHDETRTVGSALKRIINRYEDVQFCGYTVPHPAEAKIHFKIQTFEIPALEVLKRGLQDFERVCDQEIAMYEKELREFFQN